MIKAILNELYGFDFKSLEVYSSGLSKIKYLKKEDVVKIENHFKNRYGFSKEEFASCIKNAVTLLGLDIKTIDDRIENLQKLFNISEEYAVALVKRRGALINMSKDTLEKRINDLKERYNFSNETVLKMLTKYPAVLTYTIEAIIKKEKSYMKDLGIGFDDFVSIIERQPSILGFSNDDAKTKQSDYNKEYSISGTKFAKRAKSTPSILNLNEENIKNKYNFYQERYGFSEIDYGKMASKGSQVMTLSPETVLSKEILIKNAFGIETEDFAKMIFKQPAILGQSADSIKLKKQQIDDLKIPTTLLIENPNMLTAPANSMKIRYMIVRSIANREDVLKNTGWYLVNQNKSYARLCYFILNEKPVKLTHLVSNERNFQKQFGVSSASLMEMYKIDEKVIENIVDSFNEYSGEKLYLTEDEKKYLNEEMIK